MHSSLRPPTTTINIDIGNKDDIDTRESQREILNIHESA